MNRPLTSTWADHAAGALQARFGRIRPWPWNRGLWVTARERYGRRPLPPQATVDVVDLAGRPRRVAHHAGTGRPLVILPGACARLDEGLFSRLFTLAGATGRPVWMLEDRLAAPTLALTHGETPSMATMGRELAAFLQRLDEPPDILALSAGAAVARSSGLAGAARLVAWSPVLDPGAVLGRLRRRPLLWRYYRHVHRRAFRQAGLPAPDPAETWRQLAAPTDDAAPTCPTLLVRAVDDPVVPPLLAPSPTATVARLPLGGHLGFGVVAGTGVYLGPLAMDGAA